MAKFPAAFEDSTGKIQRLTGELDYLPDPTATPGDVLTVQPDGSVAAEPGGGSMPGVVRILEHDFDFTQAAALNTGVTVWTPAVGDYLLDAWIETDEPGWIFDGLNEPIADIGIITAGAFVYAGFWAAFAGALSLANAIWTSSNGKFAYVGGGAPAVSDLFAGAIGQGIGAAQNPQPSLVRFLTTDPLQLVVSADGTVGGGAFDGSAGASTLYLMVSSPVATP